MVEHSCGNKHLIPPSTMYLGRYSNVLRPKCEYCLILPIVFNALSARCALTSAAPPSLLVPSLQLFPQVVMVADDTARLTRHSRITRYFRITWYSWVTRYPLAVGARAAHVVARLSVRRRKRSAAVRVHHRLDLLGATVQV